MWTAVNRGAKSNRRASPGTADGCSDDSFVRPREDTSLNMFRRERHTVTQHIEQQAPPDREQRRIAQSLYREGSGAGVCVLIAANIFEYASELA